MTTSGAGTPASRGRVHPTPASGTVAMSEPGLHGADRELKAHVARAPQPTGREPLKQEPVLSRKPGRSPRRDVTALRPLPAGRGPRLRALVTSQPRRPPPGPRGALGSAPPGGPSPQLPAVLSAGPGAFQPPRVTLGGRLLLSCLRLDSPCSMTATRWKFPESHRTLGGS